MTALIVALIVALTIAIVLIAVIIIIKILTPWKSGTIEIHFSGGVNTDDGRLSTDSNYFKGMADSLVNTRVVGEDMRSSAQCRLCVTFYNQETNETLGFVIDRQLVLGRSTGSGIMTVNDRYVSSNHCVIRVRDGKLFLSDLNSANHTFLNGKQITRTTELHNDDVITIGNTGLRIAF